MEVWVDDLRDPKRFIGEHAEKVLWLKEARPAINYLLKEVSDQVEVLYLDHFLGDRTFTGESIVSKISYRLDNFTKLKTIYLHSSDDAVVEKVLSRFKEKFENAGIELLEAPYRFKCKSHY